MELNDKKLIQMIKKANLPELEYRIRILEDDSDMKAEGMTEVEYIEREAWWIVEDFEDDGHILHDDLRYARRLLKETKNGKVVPLDITTFKPKRGYSKEDIQEAREIVNEYNRTKRFAERLGRLLEE